MTLINPKNLAAAGIIIIIISRSKSNPAYADAYTAKATWNRNWDGRDPLSFIPERSYNEKEEPIIYDMQKYIPKTYRNIFLITNGQYVVTGEDTGLTSLGKEQAKQTSGRLLTLFYAFESKVHTSSLKRCVETAKIIAESAVTEGVVVKDDLLRDGIAIKPDPQVMRLMPGQEINDLYKDGPRLEQAFRKYFYRAAPEDMGDSFEIIVCHANVIRYFICRALQFPPEAWLRLSLRNCSITWLVINPNGMCKLRELGACGHFPNDLLTEY